MTLEGTTYIECIFVHGVPGPPLVSAFLKQSLCGGAQQSNDGVVKCSIMWGTPSRTFDLNTTHTDQWVNSAYSWICRWMKVIRSRRKSVTNTNSQSRQCCQEVWVCYTASRSRPVSAVDADLWWTCLNPSLSPLKLTWNLNWSSSWNLKMSRIYSSIAIY